jgi:hypothetical protein
MQAGSYPRTGKMEEVGEGADEGTTLTIAWRLRE